MFVFTLMPLTTHVARIYEEVPLGVGQVQLRHGLAYGGGDEEKEEEEEEEKGTTQKT